MINENLETRIRKILEQPKESITKIQAHQLRKYYKYTTKQPYDKCVCTREVFNELYDLTTKIIEGIDE